MPSDLGGVGLDGRGTGKSDGRLLASASAAWISFFHTIFGLGAFVTALFVGCWYHYRKIVKNEWYGYPEEWFPSVSATIGDWAPERPIFQILICFASGPRLFLVLVHYLLNRRPGTSLPEIVALCGLIRTTACAGWVYVTSSDNHDFHDFAMISYLVLTIPWQLGTIKCSSSAAAATGNRYRKIFSSLFFGSIVPLVYLFIQHKVHRIPGAYTKYAFIEWSLIFYDTLYDACSFVDFARLELRVVEVGAGRPANAGSGPQSSVVVEATKASAASQGRSTSDVHFFEGLTVSEVITFVADVYQGFVFWSTLTALGPVIFYFSVWSMGLGGQEVLVFCSSAPLLLAFRPIRRLCARIVPVLHLLSLVGIASYLVDRDLFYDDAVARMRAVAAGVICGTLAYAADWSAAATSPRGAARLERSTLAFAVGWIVSVVVKYANQSLNPLWPVMRANNGGWNKTGLSLALVAVAEQLSRPLRQRSTRLAYASSTVETAAVGALRSSLAFSGLIFLIHTLFTDSGTVIAWTWTGYPIKGPVPVPHGALTIAGLCLGLFLAVRSAETIGATGGLLWQAVGWAGAATLLYADDWAGYVGGWVLAVFAASLLPRYLRNAARHNPGVTFGLGFLIYAVMEVVHTFTVAYAFVPGGNAFREHTDYVLFVTMAMITLGAPSSAANPPRLSQDHLRSLVKLSGVALGALAVHFGVDSGMWESQRRMRKIIEELQLDIVGLLESDLQRIVLGNRDLTQYMSEELGMYVDLGPGPQKHTWGAALLSKFPIVNSTHHLLPSPKGELAPAIHATLDIYGTLVDVIVSHNGQEEDPVDRQLQSQELARIMREAYPRPFIFLGYVVTRPHADRPAPYKYLVEDGKMLDIEPADSDRWCEYILFRGLRRTTYARINRGHKPAVTDTEMQVGGFQIPDEPVDPDTDPAGYWTRAEATVDPSLRYPEWLKGEGVGGFKFISLHEQFEGLAGGPVYYV